MRVEALRFFSAEEVARARSYHRPLYWAAAVDGAIQVGVLAAFVWSGVGNALDPDSLPWWARTPAYAAIVIVVSAAVRTPGALWSGLIRERRWGFSTQRLPSWAADRCKAAAVNVVLTSALLLGLVALARELPGWWAAPAAGGFALATLALSYLAPVVLEPLFNRYSQLPDAALAVELRALAQRAGSPQATYSFRTRAGAPARRTHTCQGLGEHTGSSSPTHCSSRHHRRRCGSSSPTSSATAANSTSRAERCSRSPARSPPPSFSGRFSVRGWPTRTESRYCCCSGLRSRSPRCRH